ncbi:MAG: hypothetical protein R3350_03615 [Saprospiraceae bacterium]|nr:hypothetical protein [Saprospiraceae bacterium]
MNLKYSINLLIGLALIFMFPVFGTSQIQGNIEGFRGLQWGTHVDSVTIHGEEVEMELYTTTDMNKEKLYRLEEEDLTIGTAELNDIYYVFDDQDRFFRVIINGKADYNEDMEFILQNKFGPADMRFRKNGKFVRNWTLKDVSLIFEESRTKDFTVIIESDRDERDFYQINTQVDDF